MKSEALRQIYLAYINEQIERRNGKKGPRVRKPSWYEKIPLQEQPKFDDYENIWVWSDLHFWHKNVIAYCDRPFDSLEEMNETMINNHNSVVGPNDMSICVGDVAFCGATKINPDLDRLNGYKVLVAGNHDFNKGKVRALHFDEIHLSLLIDDDIAPLAFTHFPITRLPDSWVNVHGHIHNSYEMGRDQYINVSVEVIDYTPINFRDIRERAQNWVVENVKQQ